MIGRNDFRLSFNIGFSTQSHEIEAIKIVKRRHNERLGYSISEIINNPDNYFYHFGVKFMSLEILKKFKYNRTYTIGTGHKEIRQKDINDYKLINKIL